MKEAVEILKKNCPFRDINEKFSLDIHNVHRVKFFYENDTVQEGKFVKHEGGYSILWEDIQEHTMVDENNIGILVDCCMYITNDGETMEDYQNKIDNLNYKLSELEKKKLEIEAFKLKAIKSMLSDGLYLTPNQKVIKDSKVIVVEYHWGHMSNYQGDGVGAMHSYRSSCYKIEENEIDFYKSLIDFALNHTSEEFEDEMEKYYDGGREEELFEAFTDCNEMPIDTDDYEVFKDFNLEDELIFRYDVGERSCYCQGDLHNNFIEIKKVDRSYLDTFEHQEETNEH